MLRLVTIALLIAAGGCTQPPEPQLTTTSYEVDDDLLELGPNEAAVLAVSDAGRFDLVGHVVTRVGDGIPMSNLLLLTARAGGGPMGLQLDLGPELELLKSISRGQLAFPRNGESIMYPIGGASIARPVVHARGTVNWTTDTFDIEFLLGPAIRLQSGSDVASTDLANTASARVRGHLGRVCEVAVPLDSSGDVQLATVKDDSLWRSQNCLRAREMLYGSGDVLGTKQGVVK